MENTNSLSLGQFVISKAGRDKGKIFIIIDIVDEKHINIADGTLRRIESPKKKKVKHLQLTNDISAEISEKLNDGKKITNLMLRKEIEKLADDQ